MLTQQRLRELLDYDPETGIFRSRGHRKGKIVGWKNAAGYVGIWADGRIHYGHRLAWLYVHGRWPARDTDHINGIRHDNRIENLREATRTENNGNARRRSRCQSGFKGVVRVSATRFVARIRHNGRGIHLGSFRTPEHAHAAYCVAARERFGEYARFE